MSGYSGGAGGKVVFCAQSGVKQSHTGDTTATTLATIALPPLQANDQVTIEALWSRNSGGAGSVTTAAKFGNTTVSSIGISTSFFENDDYRRIANRGATNSQIFRNGSGGAGVSAAAVVTATEETNAGINVTLIGTCANAGDTVSLESYRVTVTRP